MQQIALALAGAAALGGGLPGVAAAQTAPAWSCRASAGYLNMIGSGQKGHVEPIVANGDSSTGLGKDSCATATSGFPTVPVGSDPTQGEAIFAGPTARTAIKDGLTFTQKPAAYGSVAHVVLAGGGHVLTADLTGAVALGGCSAVTGEARLIGWSQVADLVIDAKPVATSGKPQTVVDEPGFSVVANEQQTVPAAGADGGSELIQRALHVVMSKDADDYLEVVVGEARAGYRGDPAALCAAPAPPPAPASVVLGEQVRSGTAQLIGRTGCLRTAFRARVRGTSIARVVFTLDGKRIAALTAPNLGLSYAVTLHPERYLYGVHRLVARVHFAPESRTAPRTLLMSFQRCPPLLAPPRFTG